MVIIKKNDMNNEFNDLFYSDLKRYGGGVNINPLLWPLEIKYTYAFRKCYTYRTKRLLNPSYVFWRLVKKHLMYKTGIQIPDGTNIGAGFYINHFGPIIINRKAVLGKNINVSSGCIIGQEHRGERRGAPMISDNVWIGGNAVIVGHITIGSDVIIAPNAYVNFDVPSHSIVIGNPGKIIHKEFATEGYLKNTV